MPATSKAQRRFMAMCEHSPQHVQGHCPNMTQQQFHDYASTPEKGLPKRKSSLKSKLTK
jgi:hypothetical protein